MPIASISEEIPGWGANANCYAYACDCKNPTIGGTRYTATPGAAGGARVADNGDVDALTAGVLADGGVMVQQLAGTPAALPVVPANHCLVAMITSANGFHFLRRDEFTKRWSWKDGNAGSVKFNTYHTPSNRFIYINDGNIADILVDNRGHYAWGYSGMTFRQFFAVHTTGFQVAT